MDIVLVLLALVGLSVVAYFWAYPEKLIHLAAWFLCRVMYRVEVVGLENVPRDGAAVLVCNHVAFIDWLIVAGCMPRPVRFVMDHRNFNLPGIKHICQLGKVIPIAPAHEDEILLEKAFRAVKQELQNGELVFIYPEGKITRDGKLNPFKNGIDRILRETPVQVVPMAVNGLWGSFFSRKDGPAMKKLPKRFRAKVKLNIAAPVAPGEAKPKALEDIVRSLLED